MTILVHYSFVNEANPFVDRFYLLKNEDLIYRSQRDSVEIRSILDFETQRSTSSSPKLMPAHPRLTLNKPVLFANVAISSSKAALARIEDKKFCKNCRKNFMREFKELKELMSRSKESGFHFHYKGKGYVTLEAKDSQGVHKLYPRIKPIYSEAETFTDSVQEVITRLRLGHKQDLIATGKQLVKTYSVYGNSWDGSDDENHEYLAFIAISEDDPTHISQVSIS
ncbi:hypothetical protein AgCh_000316 [Apium graveolens]